MVEGPINRLKIDNSLTLASFDRLLAILGPDRESAAMAYIDLRLALFTYFAARGAACPDEMADETINRGARRLSEGARSEEHTSELQSLTNLVCRLLLEKKKKKKKTKNK